jgi:hypothetical protein
MKRMLVLAALAAMMAISAQGIADSTVKSSASETAQCSPDQGCTPCPFPCGPCDTACPIADGGAS